MAALMLLVAAVVSAKAQAGPVVSLAGQAVDEYGDGKVAVTLNARGGESALSFSVNFGSLIYTGIEVVRSEMFCIENAQQPLGRVGVACSLPPGKFFVAGSYTLLNINFHVKQVGSLPVTFGDQPVAREVVLSTAVSVLATYISGVLLGPPPSIYWLDASPDFGDDAGEPVYVFVGFVANTDTATVIASGNGYSYVLGEVPPGPHVSRFIHIGRPGLNLFTVVAEDGRVIGTNAVRR